MIDLTVLAVITLTADADLLAKLQRKLLEYNARMAFRAPETDPHAWYKIQILSRLLKKGEVKVAELRADLERLSFFHEGSFLDALGVINAYNSNELAKVSGGTGLK